MRSNPIKRINFALNYMGVCGSEGEGKYPPPTKQITPKKMHDIWLRNLYKIGPSPCYLMIPTKQSPGTYPFLFLSLSKVNWARILYQISPTKGMQTRENWVSKKTKCQKYCVIGKQVTYSNKSKIIWILIKVINVF